MDTPIIVAIIGASATVLAAFLEIIRRETRQFRSESSEQHGVLMSMVKLVVNATDEIDEDLKELKKDLADHIATHDANDPPPAKKTPAKKAPAKKR